MYCIIEFAKNLNVFTKKKKKKVTGVLIISMGGFFHNVYQMTTLKNFKYPTILLANYTSVKLQKGHS